MPDAECIFCKIVAGDLPSEKVYKDEHITAFRDIHPLAPVHILIIPNKHFTNTNELTPDDGPVVGRMLTVVPEIAKAEGIAKSGYRLIMNTGADGNQVVQHMHLHVLGGHPMQHPMG